MTTKLSIINFQFLDNYFQDHPDIKNNYFALCDEKLINKSWYDPTDPNFLEEASTNTNECLALWIDRNSNIDQTHNVLGSAIIQFPADNNQNQINVHTIVVNDADNANNIKIFIKYLFGAMSKIIEEKNYRLNYQIKPETEVLFCLEEDNDKEIKKVLYEIGCSSYKDNNFDYDNKLVFPIGILAKNNLPEQNIKYDVHV